jgi:hypothetical protein
MDGAHSGAYGRRFRFDFQAHDLKSDPRADAVVVSRGITTPVEVEAGRDSSLHERLAHAVLTENDQRDGALNPRAAARFFSREIIRGVNKRRLAHASSNEFWERIRFPA